MTVPLPGLLDPDDYARFKAGDEDWFLTEAGDAIRAYCGWHIYPVISETGVQCQVGPRDTILLQSLKVVSVESISFEGNVLDSVDYTVHGPGWVQWHPFYIVNVAAIAVEYAWPPRVDWVSVDFTHGYDTVPTPVAEVGFEMAMRSMEKPAGVVQDITAGPYRFKFGTLGSSLTEEQKCKLAPYALPGVA